MVLFNYSTKELTAKVVYYGPGLCGKTTNLQWIHEKLPIKNKGKMLSLATETDRTLFFDFLPIELGTIRGMKTRIQLYTVPGQVFYNATRRMVLKGGDCVVFVADSQEPMIEANLESLENLRQNLEANEIDPDEIPMVLQYNKRDLPNALPIEILNERLNPRSLPFYEAVAIKGTGVEETLKGATALVFRSLAAKYGGPESSTAAPGAAAPAPAPPAPLPPAAAAPPPARPRKATATLPPLRVERDAAGDEAEVVLDSLDLDVGARASGALAADAPELSVGEGDELSLEEEDIEPLPLDDVAPPRPASPPKDPKATLVREGEEVEDLRRRISRPVSPTAEELEPEEIEEVEDLDAEIEEISLDAEAELEPPPPPPPRPAPVPPPRPSPAPVAAARPLGPSVVTLPPAAPPPSPPPAAPATAAAVARVPREAEPIQTVAPVSVQLSGLPGQTDVAIPVEVTVGSGPAQVNIHLRLTLSLRIDR
jgi:signal recognition particle receptor subunit beta